SGALRSHVGKADAKASRCKDLVPAVMYGGKEQKSITVPYMDLHKILYSPEVYQVNLAIDGNTYPTIVREIQYHPITDKITHVDFLELVSGKEVIIEIPIKFTGTSPGVLAGGKLTKSLRKLRVKATAENFPEEITVDISNLNLGQTLKVKNITIPNAKLVDTPERAVAAVMATRNTQAADTAAAAPAKTAAKK
ncbi:MAG: 50S ribosomal protein L25, partial [Bacteroidia bacterium]|nr:50S ribosomal protein L25 [Bacteroidia bacterium]